MKSIREPGALLGVEFFEMLDQQLFDQILVDVNAAYIDALSDLGVKVCAWCNLYFVFHVNSQKLLLGWSSHEFSFSRSYWATYF